MKSLEEQNAERVKKVRERKQLLSRIQTIFERNHIDVFYEPVFSYYEQKRDDVTFEDNSEEFFNKILFLFKEYIGAHRPKGSDHVQRRKAMDLVFKAFMNISIYDLLRVCRDHYDWETLENWEVKGGEKQ